MPICCGKSAVSVRLCGCYSVPLPCLLSRACLELFQDKPSQLGSLCGLIQCRSPVPNLKYPPTTPGSVQCILLNVVDGLIHPGFDPGPNFRANRTDGPQRLKNEPDGVGRILRLHIPLILYLPTSRIFAKISFINPYSTGFRPSLSVDHQGL